MCTGLFRCAPQVLRPERPSARAGGAGLGRGQQVGRPPHAGPAADAVDRARRPTPRPPRCPPASRTGADTLATPDSRSATLCAQPRRRTSTSARSVNRASGSRERCTAGSAHAASTLAPGARGHRQPRADRHGVAQAAGGFGRGDADALGAVAAVELHALAGDVAQPGQHGRGRLQQRVDAARGQLGQRGARPPLPSEPRCSRPCTSSPTASRCAVARGQPRALTQLGQPARLGRGRPQHPHGFVEHADPAMLSHKRY